MQVAETFSHKSGEQFIEDNHLVELMELYDYVDSLNAKSVLTKQTRERSKPPLLFSPVDMNAHFKQNLSSNGWYPNTRRISLQGRAEFREIDGLKNRVGLEIQFGKYAFMGYDIFSKMVIFSNLDLIDCGIEVVVMPSMIRNMSTGVSSFNQIVMDMEARGEADIDIPTLIVGIEPTAQEWIEVTEKRARFSANPQQLINDGEVSMRRGGGIPGP
jgi:restriction endonuclease BglII